MNSPELQIPSSYSRIIARMLTLPERDLGKLLQGTQLPTSILLPGDETLISGQQQLQILANGHRLMNGPGFGLAMGKQLGPASHGPVGYLSLSSPDLLSALKAYGEFIPARLPLIEIKVDLDSEWIECSFGVRIDAPSYVYHGMAESFVVSIQAIVEEVLRREPIEAELLFDHQAPAYKSLYSDLLHGSIKFAMDRVCYRLPAAIAYVPNASGDSEAFRVTHDLCNSLLERQPLFQRTTADRVRTLLLTRPQVAATEDDIARAMFVSRRTLARRLYSEGTGYRQIRDQVLAELAQQFLRQTAQSVESISATLGYHDSAAFRKAFKRWTGLTPSGFREGA